MQALAKNMAAKKTPYGFVAGVTSLYVSTLCYYLASDETLRDCLRVCLNSARARSIAIKL